MFGGRIKWPVVAVAAILLLGVLLGGYYTYNHQFVDQPLEEEMLATGLVDKVDVSNTGRLKRITVSLKPVPNLQEAYQELAQIAADRFPGGLLEVKDHRDSRLSDVWYDSQYAVYQAVAQGNFQDMARQVEALASQAGVDGRIYVDLHRIYVQLESGSSYLYEIVEQPQTLEVRT